MSKTDDRRTLETALSFHRAGRLDQAVRLYRRLIDANPQNFFALHYLGAAEAAAGHFEEAKSLMRRSLAIRPPVIPFIENYASLLFQAGDYQLALQTSEEGLRLAPESVQLAYIGAVSLFRLERFQDSIAQFDRLLSRAPNHLAAINERGSVLAQMKRRDEALASFQKALALQPNYAEAHLNLSNLYGDLRRYELALAAYERALAINPALADAWLGLGNVLRQLYRHGGALAAYDKAIEINPRFAAAWAGRGHVLVQLKRQAEALAAYDKAFALNANLEEVEGLRLHTKMYLCDWTDIEAETARLSTAIRAGRPASHPFPFLSMSSSPADQLQCARIYVARTAPVQPRTSREPYSHDRVRVAYLSADFREHAVGYLLPGLFERHDRERFEITAISFGPGGESATRGRIVGACERFLDLERSTDEEMIKTIRDLEIDIAVDLAGHTRNARLGVLAARPAPIQVSYLGFLGTLGADFIDYVIADRIALPFSQQDDYAERIVHLPDCFLPNDDSLSIASHTPSRADCALPEEGFVFCSFNNSYKIARPVFAAWMRILAAVEGSVLWLLQSNGEMAANLRVEAQRCGVDPDRIVFAPRMPLSDHLARQRRADLFLDTIPYNAGATGAAALWSGLPLLTVLGDTFVGRMAASMLHAVGLPELVVEDLRTYEALAIKAATDAGFHAAIRDKLRANSPAAPLFDTDRLRSNLERAYLTMIEISRRREQPRAFSIR